MVLDHFNADSYVASPSATSDGYSYDTDSPFAPNTCMSFSSTDYGPDIVFGDARNMPLAPAPISSPSVRSTPSPIQPDTTQITGYSPDDYDLQYPNYFVHSPYADVPEDGATNRSFDYHDYGDTKYAEHPEAWSGPYEA